VPPAAWHCFVSAAAVGELRAFAARAATQTWESFAEVTDGVAAGAGSGVAWGVAWGAGVVGADGGGGDSHAARATRSAAARTAKRGRSISSW
jgi:hypothetical protein